MTIEEARRMFEPIRNESKEDEDAMLFFYFSKIEDSYCVVASIDAGDALVVISHLIGKFNLSRKAIAEMVVDDGKSKLSDAR
jgi:hypothetical protein